MPLSTLPALPPAQPGPKHLPRTGCWQNTGPIISLCSLAMKGSTNHCQQVPLELPPLVFLGNPEMPAASSPSLAWSSRGLSASTAVPLLLGVMTQLFPRASPFPLVAPIWRNGEDGVP